MAISYFKCHTLPFPSYDLATGPGTAVNRFALTWTNGPPGQATPTQTDIELTFLVDTSVTQTITAGGTATQYEATSVAGAQYRIRLRRVNSAGAGEWTPWVAGVVG
jgi:hypothetical protein